MSKKTCPNCGDTIIFNSKKYTPGEKIMLDCPSCGTKVKVVIRQPKVQVDDDEKVGYANEDTIIDTGIEETEPVDAQLEYYQQPQHEESTPAKRGINLKVVIAAVAGVLVAAAVVCAIVFSGKSTQRIDDDYDDDDEIEAVKTVEEVEEETPRHVEDAYRQERKSHNILEDAHQQMGEVSQHRDQERKQEPAKRRIDFGRLQREPISESDLVGFSAGELRILRNAIFAMHGYRFNDPALAQYFSQFDWYTPRYSDVTSMLSPIEQKNVNTIKARERRVK